MSADSCLLETRPQACHISLPKIYTAHISLLDNRLMTEKVIIRIHAWEAELKCFMSPETQIAKTMEVTDKATATRKRLVGMMNQHYQARFDERIPAVDPHSLSSQLRRMAQSDRQTHANIITAWEMCTNDPVTYRVNLTDYKREAREAPRSPQHGNGRRCVLFPETAEEGPEDQRGIDPKIAPRMASGFEPAEDFEDRWKDCTVIFGNDELDTVILLPDQQILVETEDQLIYFRDEDAVVPEDEVMKYRVLARCQHLTCGPAKKPRARADGENVNDNETLILSISDGKSVYIGQSMHMDGPVIASGTNEDKHSAAFDSKRLNLKSEPQKIITGSGTIPHFAVSSKFNLKKAKQLVHAKTLESFYRQEWELRAYNEYASRFMMDLECGFPLEALAHQDIESCRVKPGDSLRGAFSSQT